MFPKGDLLGFLDFLWAECLSWHQPTLSGHLSESVMQVCW